MIGLDQAGKTVILYRLKLGEVVTTIPTIGFNVETIKYNKIDYTLWDVGGQDKIRPLWRHYYQNTNAIIYVIDGSDPRLDDAKQELHKTSNESDINKPLLLILLNKTDLKWPKTASEIMEYLQLNTIRNKFSRVYIQSVCATTGENLELAIDWIYYNLPRNRRR